MNNRTIDFFKEISKIPRESGNEVMISDYIVNFCKERNLDYIKDQYNNVIVKKYFDDSEPIIFQAHLDMVCVKDEDISFDFFKDELQLIFEDDFIRANGTTLGADNGIGVAQILNILDSDVKRNIEAIFTVCEETTMEGALNIDLSSLKGKTMINLDGFDSDTILLESASFTDIDINTNYDFNEKSIGNLYKIKLSGLDGGHSGFDIDKNRGNAICLLSDLLMMFKDVRLASFQGGSRINVIPSCCEVIIETSEDVFAIVNLYKENLVSEYNNLDIEAMLVEGYRFVVSKDDTFKFLSSISSLGHGVINKNNRGEVTTSKNLALVNLDKNLMQVGLRSSLDEERKVVLDFLEKFSTDYNYECKIIGYQPGFSTSLDASLVKKMKHAYYKINNSFPAVKSLHIAVEVGIIKEKIDDLEVVIVSPFIMGAHTPFEKVSISSVEACDKWLFEFLNNFAK